MKNLILVGYVENEGWKISTAGKHYTPKEFESKFRYLPYPLPPKASGELLEKIREYYAHRHKNTPGYRGKGFG